MDATHQFKILFEPDTFPHVSGSVRSLNRLHVEITAACKWRCEERQWYRVSAEKAKIEMAGCGPQITNLPLISRTVA